jgi:hypothetical protein
MKNIFLLVISSLIIGCSSCKQQDAEEPIVPNVQENVSDCAPACSQARLYKCTFGEDLTFPGSSCLINADCQEQEINGTCINGKCVETCENTCEIWVEQGRYLGLECISTIVACRQIEEVCR